MVPQATKPGQPALVMDEARPVVYVALHSTRRHLLAIALATCIALGATPCLLFDHAWLRAAKGAAHVEDNACKPSPKCHEMRDACAHALEYSSNAYRHEDALSMIPI